MRQRPLQWMFVAKGIGIVLVVAGHFDPALTPRWWAQVITTIYSFHMPLFFVLSGFLYDPARRAYRELIAARSRRLLVPFITVGLTALAVKLVAGVVVELDHPVTARTMGDLLADPARSYMPLLWFVHALFLMFCFHPLQRRLLRTPEVTLVVSVFAATVLSIGAGGAERVVFHYPFFVLGIVLAGRPLIFDRLTQSTWSTIVTVAGGFVVSSAVLHATALDGAAERVTLIATGMTGSVLVVAVSRVITNEGTQTSSEPYTDSGPVHGISLAAGRAPLLLTPARLVSAVIATRGSQPPIGSTPNRLCSVLAWLGYYSMSIYLLHTFVESAIRIGAFDVVGLPSASFLAVAVVAIAAGLLGPLVLERYVLRHWQPARVLVLGLD